jgi:dTDP-L-rhamnose 4-epimerase
MAKILITGGAGFIGSHLADELIKNDYDVVVLDNLSEQVHGKNAESPAYLQNKIELIKGDIRDPKIVSAALENVEAVFHFASMVGVGQSMYEIKEYTDVNNLGTAVLLESLLKKRVAKLIVASSMSIYGEGLYKNSNGIIEQGIERNNQQLLKKDWEIHNNKNEKLTPHPTPETKVPSLSSVYALSKYDQERLCLMTGKAYNFPVTALRFFNVYGTRQSLSNPYTGVLAIFASRLLNNNPPLIFEDGNQRRDFVSVNDVVKACVLTLEKQEADGEVFNIGSGNSYSIKEIAEKMSEVMDKNIQPEITAKYRVGDIRHCYADISKAENILNYKPEISLEEGLAELACWLKDQSAEDKVPAASKELADRGLTV